MPASNSFSIQFARSLEAKEKDDIAIIECTGVDNYKIIYRDATAWNKMSFTANGSELFRWFRRVLRLLGDDSDPFQCIQLNIPAMPSVLFNIADLDKKYTTILDAVEYYIDIISKNQSAIDTPPSTPVAQRTSKSQECPAAPARRHLFFDEDGNEYSRSDGLDYVRPPIREIDFNY